MNTKNFLIATIKVPVKINSNGEIIALDDYVEVSVEPLTTEPKQSFGSVYEKLNEWNGNTKGRASEVKRKRQAVWRNVWTNCYYF